MQCKGGLGGLQARQAAHIQQGDGQQAALRDAVIRWRTLTLGHLATRAASSSTLLGRPTLTLGEQGK